MHLLVIGRQGTGLSLALQSTAPGCPESWHLLLRYPHAVGNPKPGRGGGGAANGRPLVTPQSCVPPAVYGSSSPWGPDLMPSTENDFPRGCGRGFAVGAAGPNEGQEGGKVVQLQWQMESSPGLTASAFFNMPFPF